MTDGRSAQIRSATGVRVRILGPVQLIDADGTTRDLPSKSQRRLLAMLALNPGRTVRSEYLADEIGVTIAALRTTVSRMRRCIHVDVIHSDPLGYRLEAEVDAIVFASLLGNLDTDAEPLARFARAIALWRGPALDEFSHETWALGEATRLEELRLVCLESRAAELMHRSRFGEAVAELERLIVAEPLRDRPRGLLMQALAADGRQADALRVYQEYRAYLSESVGTSPSTQVRLIEQQIAAEAGLTPDARHSYEADDTSWPAGGVGLLPMYRSSFIGRSDVISGTSDVVRARRTVTLTGTGGVGKTRLAVHVAIELSAQVQAVWFVDLAPAESLREVIGAVCLAVGEPTVESATDLADALGERRALLVLDNCEHVVGAVADMVDQFTIRCRELKVLATSRVPLGAEGEHVVPVRPLDPTAAATRLFRDRARDAGADLAAGSQHVIGAICQRLDGNPLAIELAAARSNSLGLTTILDGLDDRFSILSSNRRRAHARHQTLHAAVEWSYRLLDPSEQQLFRLLGIFSGGFELDAAQHLAARTSAAQGSLLARLGRLVDASMLGAEPHQRGTRFQLLETLRAFALAELRAHGEWEAAADAHADWVASITDRPIVEWMTAESHRCAVRLERDVANWRDAINRALDLGDHTLARRLVGGPTALLGWARPDVAPSIHAIGQRISADDPARYGVVLASWGPAWSRLDLPAMRVIETELAAADPTDAAGGLAITAAGRQAIEGDLAVAVAERRRTFDDAQLPTGVRDFLLALTLYLVSSRNAPQLRDHDMVARVTSIVERSDVPANRMLACIALAWSCAIDGDDADADRWALTALNTDVELPEFHHNLVGTFVSRYLARRTPSLAAKRMRVLVDALQGKPGLADSILLVTSAGLMAATNHRDTDDVVATLALTGALPFLTNLVPDTSDRQALGKYLRSDELIARVRVALDEIAHAEQ